MAQDDHIFVRDGRTLADWLPETVSEDFETRRRAGEALAAMYMEIPSVHTNLETMIDAPRQEPKVCQAAWRRAVKEAVDAVGFPRAEFVRALIDRVIEISEDGQRRWREEDARVERVLDRIRAKRDAATSEAQSQLYRGWMVRVMRAGASREVREDERFMCHHITLMWIIESLDAALLTAQDALIRLLGHDALKSWATRALERIGAPARERFLEIMLDRWLRDPWGDSEMPRALAAIAGNEPSQIRRALTWIDEAIARTDPLSPLSDQGRSDDRFHRDFYKGDRSWRAAELFHAIGPSVLATPGLGHEVLSALLRLSHSARAGHRAAATYALGGACRDGDPAPAAVLERLLELTSDHSWVAGRAIDALGEVRSDARRVVPRLMQLFDEFQEFDPDEAYGGGHSRVCRALARFGAEATPAVPRLTRELKSAAADELWEVHQDVLGALAAIGPAAAEALPVLEEKRRELRNLQRDEEAAKVRDVVGQIREVT